MKPFVEGEKGSYFCYFYFSEIKIRAIAVLISVYIGYIALYRQEKDDKNSSNIMCKLYHVLLYLCQSRMK